MLLASVILYYITPANAGIRLTEKTDIENDVFEELACFRGDIFLVDIDADSQKDRDELYQ